MRPRSTLTVSHRDGSSTSRKHNRLESAIVAIVHRELARRLPEEIQSALAPHLRALTLVEEFLAATHRDGTGAHGSENAPPTRAPSATEAGKSHRARAQRTARAGKLQTAAERGDARPFKPGQRVRFNMGRGGMADGVVVRTDVKRGTVFIRHSNGTILGRPPVRVQRVQDSSRSRG